MSLVKQSEKNSLPSNQNMDLDTLLWIQSQNPFPITINPIDHDLIDKASKYVKSFVPLDSWFINVQRTKTIHGKRHLIRVSIYVYILCNHSFSDSKLKTTIVASALHDIRRKTDKKDKGHAYESAVWFKENIDEIKTIFNLTLDEGEIDTIYNAILFHEVPTENIEKNVYEKFGDEIEILKTADALDRYIQPNKDWWIVEKYLNIIPSLELKHFAYNLVIDSETAFLNGASCEDSIFKSIRI